MRFLDTERVLSNMRAAVRHLAHADPPRSDLKRAFIQALNAAQSTTIGTLDQDIFVDFENPDLVALLVKRTVFSSEEVADGVHLIPHTERDRIAANIGAAKELLRRADPKLHDLVIQLVGSVAAYRIPSRDGGSVSCCIGLIWLSPREDWPIPYYAEMLVHEFVHNSVFLEDMVQGVMPNPHLLDHEDALSISAIRQTRRPYDKAFHSACVSAALMRFYEALGRQTDSLRYQIPLRRTVADLIEHDRTLRASGLDVLTDNGRCMLEELRAFAESWPKVAIGMPARTSA